MTFTSGPLTINPQGGSVVTGNIADMSLLKNVAGQKFTFELIAAATDTGLTGQAANIAAWINTDGTQAAAAGSFVELDSVNAPGMYSYSIQQAETNANCIGVWITCPNALPLHLLFLTSGLHRNQPSQHIGFGMVTVSGLADASATVTAKISVDSNAPATGAGTTTNLGHGQYDYAPTQGETNGTRQVSYNFQATSDVPQNICIFTVT